MESKGFFSILLFLFLFHLFMGSAASTFLSSPSNYVSVPEGSTGRKLLQEKDCPVDFEFVNYTVLTSQCKAPEYSSQLCCSAFNEVACPYMNELNDNTNNDCIGTMLSYVDLIGNYPPGLFHNCWGVAYSCNNTALPTSVDANGGWIPQTFSPFLTLMALFPSLFFQIL